MLISVLLWQKSLETNEINLIISMKVLQHEGK